MGSTVCTKCGISSHSPYIIDNSNRLHCRFHNRRGGLICTDCHYSTNNKNCRHSFKFKLICCS